MEDCKHRIDECFSPPPSCSVSSVVKSIIWAQKKRLHGWRVSPVQPGGGGNEDRRQYSVLFLNHSDLSGKAKPMPEGKSRYETYLPSAS
jgi:hypothetical protein